MPAANKFTLCAYAHDCCTWRPIQRSAFNQWNASKINWIGAFTWQKWELGIPHRRHDEIADATFDQINGWLLHDDVKADNQTKCYVEIGGECWIVGYRCLWRRTIAEQIEFPVAVNRNVNMPPSCCTASTLTLIWWCHCDRKQRPCCTCDSPVRDTRHSPHRPEHSLCPRRCNSTSSWHWWPHIFGPDLTSTRALPSLRNIFAGHMVESNPWHWALQSVKRCCWVQILERPECRRLWPRLTRWSWWIASHSPQRLLHFLRAHIQPRRPSKRVLLLKTPLTMHILTARNVNLRREFQWNENVQKMREREWHQQWDNESNGLNDIDLWLLSFIYLFAFCFSGESIFIRLMTSKMYINILGLCLFFLFLKISMLHVLSSFAAAAVPDVCIQRDKTANTTIVNPVNSFSQWSKITRNYC